MVTSRVTTARLEQTFVDGAHDRLRSYYYIITGGLVSTARDGRNQKIDRLYYYSIYDGSLVTCVVSGE